MVRRGDHAASSASGDRRAIEAACLDAGLVEVHRDDPATDASFPGRAACAWAVETEEEARSGRKMEAGERLWWTGPATTDAGTRMAAIGTSAPVQP